MISELQSQPINNFCPVAKVYAATKAEKVDCNSDCASATNAFDTAAPLAKDRMGTDPITTVTTDGGKIKQLYEYLGNGNDAPTSPDYNTSTAIALRKELLATANAGKSSAIFWTSQGLHVLGGVIINGTSIVPDKNFGAKVSPPRNAVYIFAAAGSAHNIAKFKDTPAPPSLYVQCFNFVGASVGVTPRGPRFIVPGDDHDDDPPQQLYYCGRDAETVLGGTLPGPCALNVQCGVIPNDQNKDINGKICNTTVTSVPPPGYVIPRTAGTGTFGACK